MKTNYCVLNPAPSPTSPSIKGTCSSHYTLLPPRHNLKKGSWVFRATGWGTRRRNKKGGEGVAG